MSTTTTRKPFDLQAAIRGEPIVTRDGRPARFVAQVPEATHYPVIAIVSGGNAVTSHTNDGEEYNDGTESDDDLFMSVTTRTVYYNLYAGDFPGAASRCYRHNTAEDAREAVGRGNGSVLVAAAVPVEIPA